MIIHVVAFRFKDDISSERRADVLEELKSFPRSYPDMRRFILGKNESARERRLDWAFAVEFNNQRELDAYLNSESHETFVRTRWRPVVAEQAIVSMHR